MPGAPTSSSSPSGRAEAQPLAGRRARRPDARRRAADHRPAPARAGVLTRLADAGQEAALVGGACATSSGARHRLGRRHRRPPEEVASLFPGRPGRTGSGPSPSAPSRSSRSPRTGPRARTATAAARTRCASACRWPRTSPGATSRSTRWRGCRSTSKPPRNARRPGRRPIGPRRGVLRAVGEPANASPRTPFAWSGRRGSPDGSA